MKKLGYFILSLWCCVQLSTAQTNAYEVYTVAFYNLENLFDPIDDPEKNDEASPLMELKKDREGVYQQKLNKLSHVLADIGFERTKASPALIGVAEVENRRVLEDLVQTALLRPKNYGIVHADSPDARGIDVALLYQKDQFIPLSQHSHTLRIWSEKGHRIPTRSPLVVSGYLGDALLHIIVNHWPSRRGGEAKSRRFREQAALLNKHIVDSLFLREPGAKILLMGDLNDDPINTSLKAVLKTQSSPKNLADTTFYNPFEKLFEKGYGSLGYRDNLHLFDQILLNGALLSKDKQFHSLGFFKSAVFNPDYLYLQKGRYKGYPFRSFANGNFTGGYSNHFPVYVILIKKA